MVEHNKETEKLGYAALGIGLYFFLMPFDLISVGRIGSLLRVVALLPIGVIIFNFNKCTLNSKEALFIILYVVYKQLSVIYTVFPTFTYPETSRLFSNALLIIILGCFYYMNTRELQFLKFSLFASTLLMILLLILFADFSAAGRLTLRTSANEADQNYIVGYLLYNIPFSVEQIVRKKRYICFLPIIIVYTLIFMTGSRGGLITLFSVTVISVFGEIRKSNKSLRTYIIPLLISIGLAVAALIVLFQFMDPAVLERFSPDYVEEKGTTGRGEIWAYLIKLFMRAPLARELFGHGTAVTPFVNRINTRMAGHVAHNLWVDELITGGLIGLILLLLMHAAFLYVAVKCRDVFTTAAFFGFLTMCMNLSITSYKPMWNCMILIMLIHKHWKMAHRHGVIQNDSSVQTEAS